MKSQGIYHRDASNRLTLELYDIDASMYRLLRTRIAEHFDLEPASETVSDGCVIFRDYKQNDRVLGIEWDNWSGFIVVAKGVNAERLVKEVGDWVVERNICERIESRQGMELKDRDSAGE